MDITTKMCTWTGYLIVHFKRHCNRVVRLAWLCCRKSLKGHEFEAGLCNSTITSQQRCVHGQVILQYVSRGTVIKWLDWLGHVAESH